MGRNRCLVPPVPVRRSARLQLQNAQNERQHVDSSASSSSYYSSTSSSASSSTTFPESQMGATQSRHPPRLGLEAQAPAPQLPHDGEHQDKQPPVKSNVTPQFGLVTPMTQRGVAHQHTSLPTALAAQPATNSSIAVSSAGASSNVIDLTLEDDDATPFAPQQVIDLVSDSEDDIGVVPPSAAQRPLPTFVPLVWNAVETDDERPVPIFGGRDPVAAQQTWRLTRARAAVSWLGPPALTPLRLPPGYSASAGRPRSLAVERISAIWPAPLPAPEALPPAGDSGGALVMFTDGSVQRRCEGGSGIAYQHNRAWYGRAVALGRVFDNNIAELEAIRHALTMARAIVPRIGATKVIVQTDSEACLVALSAKERGVNPAKVLQAVCEAALREKTALGVEVAFWWVRGHIHTAGNERADMLADYGAGKSMSGYAGQAYDNPIADELDRAMRHHAAAAREDRRDLVLTGATTLPQNSVRRNAAERHALKVNKRLQRRRGAIRVGA